MNTQFEKRIQKNIKQLHETYMQLYEKLGATEKDFSSLLSMMKNRYEERDTRMRNLDKRNSKWYMSRKMIGYMAYVDLFAGDLKNLITKIPYLKELGVTYVHLMPLLKPIDGENDGGYAVEDYLDIDPKLGTSDDFENVLKAFDEADIAVCIDYVINHTADTHEWAQKALQGDLFYQNMFYMFDDRTIPDVYDQYVPEVLPDKCPGNFTFKKEIQKWVFTSFSDFQWDLNFKNPYVFEQMVNIMLKLANKGVNIIRLDAIPFMWKEEGTSCRNLPEIHDLIYMINLIKDIVCPSLALLGEAIVEPHEIYKYFGNDVKLECGLLYNANYMVNIWNAFASRDVRLLNIDNSRFTPPQKGCWMNYIRCHDDIGWGLNEKALFEMGIDSFLHKQYLIDFYSGNFLGSFAKGENYQYNKTTKDARTNGTTASLLGLELAIEEKYVIEQDIAIRRILLAHSLILSHRGIPLIYSGDEIATLNDQSYKNNPNKVNEGRWVHRPIFDWKRAEKRKQINTFENKVFEGLKRMISIRKKQTLFDGDIPVQVISNSDIGVFSFQKRKGSKQLLCVHNFSEYITFTSTHSYRMINITGRMVDIITGRVIDFTHENIRLAPYEFLWLMPIGKNGV